ncbi:MoaD/ThiS family protein [Arcanobacterium canis]
MNIEVRYFAGIAQEMGTSVEELDVPDALTLDELVQMLSERHGTQAAHQLGVCAFLLNGSVAPRETQLPLNAVIDVLPPFAGG